MRGQIYYFNFGNIAKIIPDFYLTINLFFST
jgi:hypothetical protein